MSVCLAVAVGDVGLLATDTRTSLADPSVFEGRSITEVAQAPDVHWDHLDHGGKLVAWTWPPIAGFLAYYGGDFRWGRAIAREVLEYSPRSFEEVERFCVPDWPPLHPVAALLVGPGPDGAAAIQQWKRWAEPGRALEVKATSPGRGNLSFIDPLPAGLTPEACAPISARLRHRIAIARGTIPGLLAAIGHYVAEVADGSQFVSRTVDLGFWHAGVGEAVRFPVEELVRIGESGRWTAADRAAGAERFRAACGAVRAIADGAEPT